MKTKKPQVRGNAKKRFIEVATQLFSEKGFDGVSTSEICTVAKLNSALICFHFGGKEGLLLTIFHEADKVDLTEACRFLHEPKSIDDPKNFFQCNSGNNKLS